MNNTSNHFIHRCSRCIFLTEQMFFTDAYCPICCFIPVPKKTHEEKRTEQITLLYDTRQKLQQNLDALTPRMDPLGTIEQYLRLQIKQCDLKIEEITNM